MTKQQDSITTPTKRTKKSVENPADSSITKVAPKAKRVVKISTPSAKANVVAETNKKKITKGASKTTLKKKVAEETAKLTQSGILKQAGIAVLTQANQSPSAALNLLR